MLLSVTVLGLAIASPAASAAGPAQGNQARLDSGTPGLTYDIVPVAEDGSVHVDVNALVLAHYPDAPAGAYVTLDDIFDNNRGVIDADGKGLTFSSLPGYYDDTAPGGLPDGVYHGRELGDEQTCVCELVAHNWANAPSEPVEDIFFPATRIPAVAVERQATTDVGQPVTSPDPLAAEPTDAGPYLLGPLSAAHGSAVADPATGVVTYTPVAGFEGTDTVTGTIVQTLPPHIVEDAIRDADRPAADDPTPATGTTPVPYTLTVTVGSIPVVPLTSTPDSVATLEDVPVTVPVIDDVVRPSSAGATLGDIDAASHGSVGRHGNSIVYTPAPGYVGADSIGFDATDASGGKTSNVIDIRVADVAPSVSDSSAKTLENTPVSIVPTFTVPPGSSGTLCQAARPNHGTAAVAPDGSLVYTPDNGYTGADGFAFGVCDPQGGEGFAVATVTVTPPAVAPPVIAAPVVVPPVVTAPVVTTPVTPPVAVLAVVKTAAAAAADQGSTEAGHAVVVRVLANDTIPSGLRVTSVTITQPGHGEATTGLDEVRYVPATTFHGTDSLVYTDHLSNGSAVSATVTFTVAAATRAKPVPIVQPVKPLAFTGAAAPIGALLEAGLGMLTLGGLLTVSAPVLRRRRRNST